MTNINLLKELRRQTGISFTECKKALERTRGDLEKAKEILKKEGIKFAAKKRERKVGAGIIDSYIHPNKKVGVLLDIRCETDFVANNKEFQKLAHEICLQIAAMNPEDKKVLLEEPWIRDESRKVKDLISEYVAKIGENIVVEKFVRYEL